MVIFQEKNHFKHITTNPPWKNIFGWGVDVNNDAKLNGSLFQVSDECIIECESAKLATEMQMS